MKMHRAYSMLEVKAVDADQRIITGIATTPSPDRMGDIVEPLGVEFKNPMPLLWQHRSGEPVGTVKFSKPTKNGIQFEARMPTVNEPGKLKERIDEAWQSVKIGLVRAVSIGFRAIEMSFMKDGGIHYLKSEVLELSLVTIPAQADAQIESIKAIDLPLLAASGIETEERPTPGVTGKPVPAKGKPKMKTIAERIADAEAKRAANVARMNAILEEAEGVTLDMAQKEESSILQSEVEEIDDLLVRLRKLDDLNKKAAVPAVRQPAAVDGGAPAAASAARSGLVVVRQPKLPLGTAFVRMVCALAASKGNRFEAVQFAERWKDSTPEVANVLRIPHDQIERFEVIEKAPVLPGTTTGSTWAEPLVQYQNMAGEFIEFLRPQTVIGRIEGFRRVPFKIKVPRQTAGAVVNWVGEAKPKPLSSLALDSITLDFFKIAGIIPLSEELVRFSSPSAEALVRADLAAAISQFMDSEFLDPAKAEVAGVSPASITNGVAAIPASGTNYAAFVTDVKTLFNTYLAGNVPISGGAWIMKQGRALSLSLMQNPLGASQFPGLGLGGGTLLGFPVITSEAVPSTGGSPGGGDLIIFLIPQEVMLADEGGVTIDLSREASLQMDTAPDNPATATTVMISLWQHNLVGIKAERFINWKKRRASAVQYISGAKYG
jgi:HK97 family phage major capsid protein/HK97 family phage prohead protease